MISKITIKDVASYKKEAILETDKRVNLIYGLNGVGKSTIAALSVIIEDDEQGNDQKIQTLFGISPIYERSLENFADAVCIIQKSQTLSDLFRIGNA